MSKKPITNWLGSHKSAAQLNKYTCQSCGGSIITIDRDKGVTPMMLMCRATPPCGGTMLSSMYQGVEGEPTYEWRKPAPQERIRMSPQMIDHIDAGGLDIYPIKGGS